MTFATSSGVWRNFRKPFAGTRECVSVLTNRITKDARYYTRTRLKHLVNVPCDIMFHKHDIFLLYACVCACTWHNRGRYSKPTLTYARYPCVKVSDNAQVPKCHSYVRNIVIHTRDLLICLFLIYIWKYQKIYCETFQQNFNFFRNRLSLERILFIVTTTI